MRTGRAGIAVMAVASVAGVLPAADARPPGLDLAGARVFSVRNSELGDDAIIDIAASPMDEIWVATAKGITIIDRDGRMRLSSWHGRKRCHQVAFAADGAVWAHCGPGALSERRGAAWFPAPLPAEGYSIADIQFDSFGRPWVATNVGLFARIGSEWKPVPLPHSGSLKASAVACVAAEPGESVLAHVAIHGVVRINVRTLAFETVFAEKDSGCPLRVNRAGEAWFATRQGLYRLGADGRAAERAPVAAFKVVDIAFDRRDRPWISTRLGGIFALDGGRWITVAPERRRSRDDELGSLPLAFDREGNLWTGGSTSRYFSAPEGTGLLRLPFAALPP